MKSIKYCALSFSGQRSHLDYGQGGGEDDKQSKYERYPKTGPYAEMGLGEKEDRGGREPKRMPAKRRMVYIGECHDRLWVWSSNETV